MQWFLCFYCLHDIYTEAPKSPDKISVQEDIEAAPRKIFISNSFKPNEIRSRLAIIPSFGPGPIRGRDNHTFSAMSGTPGPSDGLYT